MKTLPLSAIVNGCFIAFSVSSDQNIAGQRNPFANPPDDSGMMMRWWWCGPAVAKTEPECEMKLMKQGGIGGFEVQPVYPVAFDDERGVVPGQP